jgi:hypothetical protein
MGTFKPLMPQATLGAMGFGHTNEERDRQLAMAFGHGVSLENSHMLGPSAFQGAEYPNFSRRFYGDYDAPRRGLYEDSNRRAFEGGGRRGAAGTMFGWSSGRDREEDEVMKVVNEIVCSILCAYVIVHVGVHVNADTHAHACKSIYVCVCVCVCVSFCTL